MPKRKTTPAPRRSPGSANVPGFAGLSKGGAAGTRSTKWGSHPGSSAKSAASSAARKPRKKKGS